MLCPSNGKWGARLVHGRWAEGKAAEAEWARSGSALKSMIYSALHVSKWSTLSC